MGVVPHTLLNLCTTVTVWETNPPQHSLTAIQDDTWKHQKYNGDNTNRKVKATLTAYACYVMLHVILHNWQEHVSICSNHVNV